MSEVLAQVPMSTKRGCRGQWPRGRRHSVEKILSSCWKLLFTWNRLHEVDQCQSLSICVDNPISLQKELEEQRFGIKQI